MQAAARSPLVVPAAALLLLAGLVFAGLRVAYDTFDADELQHAHIAWLVAGGKIIYRDFWDNHGPLFALANGALLRLSGAAPGIDLLFWCRYASMVALGGILLLTWRIARQLALPAATALLAAAILASLVFVQDRAPECRPDTWQNLFWFAGLSVLLSHLRRRRSSACVLAGTLFGLAILTNVKAGMAPAIVALYYLLGRRLHGLSGREVWRDLIRLALGGGLVYALVLAYFVARGAVAEFHAFTTVWNFMYVDPAPPVNLRLANIGFLLEQQLPFVIAFVAGLVFWLRGLRSNDATLPAASAWLVAVLSILMGLSLGLNFYFQFFLIFLPLWAIVAATGLTGVAELLARWFPSLRTWLPGVLVVIFAGVMVTTALRLTPLLERSELRFQKSFTTMMLQATPRTEPLGVIFGDICGGFMFNEPLQYYWGAEPAIGATAERYGGVNPFGRPLIDALERRQVRFVVGRETVIVARLPAVTQHYLVEHYDRGNCLWTRKRAAAGSE